MGEFKSYVAIAPCGCLKGAAVDNPDRRSSTGKYVGGWIKLGFRIEYVTTETVRTMPWLCPEHQAEMDARRAVGGKQQPMMEA